MSNNNYSEQIFQSIDTIISLRLNEVSFDKTEICEIVSLDKDNTNKYWVSNGSLKYEAYSTDENRKYLTNQKVYVTVPQGNYDLRKLIIGSYSADETNENLYVNPFNYLVASSSYNVSDIIITTNTSGTSTSDSRDLELKFNYSNTIDFDYIGLEFGLDTSSLQGTYKGTYSIELLIYNNKDEQLNTSRIILYNTDLYGNPYGLIPMLKFLHLFPFPEEIENITDIAKIQVLFAQDGNFEKAGDIKLQDIKLYFGYDSKVIDTNQLSLYLSQEQSIDYQKNDTNLIRNLYLEWQHIDNSGKLHIFNTNQNAISNLEYYIYWMKYVSGYKKENENDIEESGTYWKTLEVYNHLSKINPFRYLIELNTNINTDLYKVGIKYKYSNETDWKYIEAPGIVFNNLDILTPPGGTNSSQDSIRLELDEGDTGIYNYYGLDGNIVDLSYLKTRNITAKFIDAITFDNEFLERVEWEFPSENSTMIVRLSENEWDKALFKINSGYLPGAMNNRIWCRAYFSTGEIRLGSLTLQFGESSTSGSAYKLNIDFVGNDVCIRPGKTIAVKAKFEREDGSTIETEPIIEWSFYKNSISPLILNNTEGVETTITAPTDILNNYENFAILLATVENYTIDNGLSTNLTAYLPIPAAADSYSYISGTTRIVYDALGNSVSLSKEKYLLFDIDYNIVENVVWRLTAPTKNEKEYYSFIDIQEEEPEIYYDDNEFNYSTLEVPQFKLYNNEISLVPLSYIPKEPEVVCLTANLIENEESIIVWSLPIFTMQNTWQYDLINNWNGSFTINKEEGSLLAPLLVAGKKEEDNQFTGVMLGNVELEGEKASGLYGFLQGSARFYFTENGEAYIGNGVHHFHLNDDGELDIKVKNFDLNANNGALIISDSEGIKLGEKISINPSGTVTVGGWNISNNALYILINERSLVGIASITGDYYPSFWAGYNGTKETPLNDANFKENTNFYVTSTGHLYAKDAVIQGQIVSGTQFGDDNLTIETKYNSSGTLDFSRINHKDKSYIKFGNDSLDLYTHNGTSITFSLNASETSLILLDNKVINLNAPNTYVLGSMRINENVDINGSIELESYMNINNHLWVKDYITTNGYITANGGVYSTNQINVQYNNDTYPAIYSTGEIYSKKLINGNRVYLESEYDGTQLYLINYRYWISFGWRSLGSGEDPPPRIKAENGNLYLHACNSSTYKIYAGGEASDDVIATQGGAPSSINLKTNLLDILTEYDNIYNDLQQIKMYNYDYKYLNMNNDNIAKYGFIIDEIENTQTLSQYFKHYNKYGKILGLNLMQSNENDYDIEYKTWDRDSYIKGLLILIKALQNKIDLLEKEIKEIKQNAI